MAKRKKIKPREARRGIYFDFEGRKGEDPVLLGVLYQSDGETDAWVIEQYLLDEHLRPVDDAIGSPTVRLALDEALHRIVDRSDAERRPLISWSEHDREIAKAATNQRSFRYRNAINTAKRWRRRARDAGSIIDDPSVANSLSHYESLIGYDRPLERFTTGDSIAYIRKRTSATPKARERWTTLLEHNRHDLLAMRAVVYTALGLDPLDPGYVGELRE